MSCAGGKLSEKEKEDRELIRKLKEQVEIERKNTFSILFPSLCWETCILTNWAVQVAEDSRQKAT